MKRCNNCGWSENPDTNNRCDKCNSPLFDDAAISNHTAQDVNISDPEVINQRRTVLEMGAQGNPTRNSSRQTMQKLFSDDQTVTEEGRCPHCDYPLRKGAIVCPQCHAELRKREVAPSYPKEEHPVMHHAPIAPRKERVINPDLNRTISPGMHRRHQINLTAVNNYGDPKFISLDLTFNEEEVTLNRTNVEADNPTISRNQHALLTFEDDKWFLENKSSSLSTSLVLTRKHEIQSGDIIIIGDRTFEVSF